MTRTHKIIAALALTGALLGTAPTASAATPTHTTTTTVTTTARGVTTCTTVKDVQASGDYRTVKACRKPRGGTSRSVAVKVGAKVTTTTDTLTISAKGARTVTHTVTVSVSGHRVSQTRTKG